MFNVVAATKAANANLRIEIIGSPFCPAMGTSLTSTLSARHTDRMGSGFGGERQGQEIVDAANSAGTQSATSLGHRQLCRLRSDSTMQHNRCIGPIQRFYRRDKDRARDAGNRA